MSKEIFTFVSPFTWCEEALKKLNKNSKHERWRQRQWLSIHRKQKIALSFYHFHLKTLKTKYFLEKKSNLAFWYLILSQV